MKIKDDENVLISYKGPINEKLIMEICSDIRLKLGSSEEIIQKVFSIFIELSSNVLNYSADIVRLFGKNGEPVGMITLNEKGGDYLLTTGNLIGLPQYQNFKKKCEFINALSREDLRKAKREQRIKSLEENEAEDRAGIGLMRVALTANSPLAFDSINVDENYAFFTLTVNIKRN
jgi:hypothetical protein